MRAFKWIDSPRMLEAAKINAPLHFENLVQLGVPQAKPKAPDILIEKIRESFGRSR